MNAAPAATAVWLLAGVPHGCEFPLQREHLRRDRLCGGVRREHQRENHLAAIAIWQHAREQTARVIVGGDEVDGPRARLRHHVDREFRVVTGDEPARSARTYTRSKTGSPCGQI